MIHSSVLDRMQATLQAWEQAADPPMVFLSCYQLMTSNVQQAIQAGEFHDGIWVGVAHAGLEPMPCAG